MMLSPLIDRAHWRLQTLAQPISNARLGGEFSEHELDNMTMDSTVSMEQRDIVEAIVVIATTLLLGIVSLEKTNGSSRRFRFDFLRVF